MGVYIKGLQKPKDCNSCIFGFKHNSIRFCMISMNYYTISDVVSCPMISVDAPHGRLIDADKLVTSLLPDPIMEMGCPEPEGIEDFCMWLDMADTVIDREEKEC